MGRGATATGAQDHAATVAVMCGMAGLRQHGVQLHRATMVTLLFFLGFGTRSLKLPAYRNLAPGKRCVAADTE